jgi:uncharacterized membrane protein (DUF4010 family)
VGLLVGAQREEAGGDPGLRDFLLVSLAGGICGLIENPYLDGGALLGVAAIFAALRFTTPAEHTGITTALAGITTFLLSVLAASTQFPFGRPLAIGVTIVVVIFLEARSRLHKLLRETITEKEFNATLAFVAVVLVIYPVLPTGSYGIYQFFNPRQVWMFVILISSISYLGYFFEKFLGEEKGLMYTSILGGLASTTAATLHFAKLSKERPEETLGLSRAFVLANTVQFPRAFFIVILVDQPLAMLLLWPLAAMTLCGLVMEEVLRRWPHKLVKTLEMKSGNPFRILPALRFGALFTAVVFISKAASVKLGTGAFYAIGLVGGLVDVATVIAPAADLIHAHQLTMNVAGGAILLALVSNAISKIVLAALSGTVGFTLRVAAAFAIWAAVGAATWFLVTKI